MLNFLLFAFEDMIEHAVKTSPICCVALEEHERWIIANQWGFEFVAIGLQQHKERGRDINKEAMHALSERWTAFVQQLEAQPNAVIGATPYNKLKKMPDIVKQALLIEDFNTEIAHNKSYIVLGEDWLGRSEASDIKCALWLLLGAQKTPFVFYHILQGVTGAPDADSSAAIYIHNGYTFGGQRREGSGEWEQAMGPQDCSSWVAGLLNIDPDTFYTGLIPTLPMLERVMIHDIEQDIAPGQLLFHPGHVALVFGWLKKTNAVVVLEYNRDRESTHIEGFGFRAIPLIEQDGKCVKQSDKKEVQFLKAI